MSHLSHNEIHALRNVAAGVGINLTVLNNIYLQIKNRGILHESDIRQLAGHGIPIYKELAKLLGVPIGEVNNHVYKGNLRFNHIQQVFGNMVARDGIFHEILKFQP